MLVEFFAGPNSAPAQTTCIWLVGHGRFYHCAIPAFLIEVIISGNKRHKVSHLLLILVTTSWLQYTSNSRFVCYLVTRWLQRHCILHGNRSWTEMKTTKSNLSLKLGLMMGLLQRRILEIWILLYQHLPLLYLRKRLQTISFAPSILVWDGRGLVSRTAAGILRLRKHGIHALAFAVILLNSNF